MVCLQIHVSWLTASNVSFAKKIVGKNANLQNQRSCPYYLLIRLAVLVLASACWFAFVPRRCLSKQETTHILISLWTNALVCHHVWTLSDQRSLHTHMYIQYVTLTRTESLYSTASWALCWLIVTICCLILSDFPSRSGAALCIVCRFFCLASTWFSKFFLLCVCEDSSF